MRFFFRKIVFEQKTKKKGINSGKLIKMPSANVAPKKYFLEKDRVESFKWWPFSDRQKCSIRKVIYL